MENMQQSELNTGNTGKKKPTFLIVLLVLSSISLTLALFNVVSALIRGPLSEEGMEEAMNSLYVSMEQIQNEGIGVGFVDMIQKVIDYTTYINNETYYLNSFLELFTVLVGIVSLYFLFHLKKIGFHIYVLYSLLPIITMYIAVPTELVLGVVIIWYTFVAALFCVLYGLNIKHMK